MKHTTVAAIVLATIGAGCEAPDTREELREPHTAPMGAEREPTAEPQEGILVPWSAAESDEDGAGSLQSEIAVWLAHKAVDKAFDQIEEAYGERLEPPANDALTAK